MARRCSQHESLPVHNRRKPNCNPQYLAPDFSYSGPGRQITARRRGNCLLKGPASQLPCAEDLGVTVDLLHISEGDPLGGQQNGMRHRVTV